MKKTFISMLLLVASAGYAQGDLSKVPAPTAKAKQPSTVATVRTPHITGNFWGDVPFRHTMKTGGKPWLIRQVGDNTSIYGCLVSAENMPDDGSTYGIYNFLAAPNAPVSALKTGAGFKSNSAVFANGKYYSFYVEEAWGWVAYLACTVYNADTWEIEKVFEPSAEWSNVPNSSAITFDAQSGKVYAVTSQEFGGPYILCTLNEADGTFEKVADLERSYLTLAASPGGVLYAVADDGKLYAVDKVSGQSRLVGDTGLRPQYSQSMTFDPNTGLLYWAFMSEAGSALYQLNASTATPYKISDMPEHQEFVGLYVNRDAVADKAPQAVAQLAFTPDVAGGTTGTVSCVAPTATEDGTALAGTVRVRVYSGDELLLDENAAPGSMVSKAGVAFDANTLYSIFATASNDAGQSRKATTTVYIGKDVATAPTNVRLKIADRKATLTWEAPTRGLNDGYVNPDDITYKVVRNSGTDKTTVAEGLAGVTSFTEDIPSATAKYSYTVTAYSGGAEGGSATSNGELSVGSYELPYYENFADGDACKQLFTFVDSDNDGHDNYSHWYWKEDERLMQYCSDYEHAGNDWLFTPAIHLDGTHLYNLKFNINMGSESNLRVTVGKSPSSDGQQEIVDLNGVNEGWETEHTATFKVDGDANYYIGFYNYSNENCNYFNLFDIGVEQGIESNVPDSVTAFSATPDTNGRQSVRLKFKAPSALLNGEPISGGMDISVYRNNQLAATIAATAGQDIEYNDDKAINGNNAYEVAAVYNGKEGISAVRTVWAGYDISEPVKDLKLRTVDGNMHVALSWTAPEKGVNNGYFNPADITYTVWRSKDGKNFDEIINLLDEPAYTDTDVEDLVKYGQEIYYYAVTADTEAGNSDSKPEFVSVGKPYTFPAKESFADGRLSLNPWSYKSVAGELGWQTIRSDESGGGWPQDNDNGFLKFANNWGDWYVDSRLITPVVSMAGTETPTFSFYMFHWLDRSVSSDNKQTMLMIEVAPDGGDFDEPIATFTAADDNYGWVEHRVSLDKYKNCNYIQVALRGYVENNWMYYYVDNINFDEQKAHDLAATGFSGDTEASINDSCQFTLKYLNRGLETASGYSILLKQDGKVVDTVEGEPLAPGENKTVDLAAAINATMAGAISEFKAEIVYNADEDQSNNTSTAVKTSVKSSAYPCVENLTAERDGTNARLAWTAPVLPDVERPTVDGMEDYKPFAISGFGDWISYDADQLGSGKVNTLPDFANQNSNKAFQVWCPGELDGVNAETYPDLMPHSGDKCLIAWYANVSIDGATPQNDDYLISPEINGGSELSFYIKRINPNVGGETYEVMYSTTTQDPLAFKVLKDGEAPADWEEVKATLPEDARYFAIHYTAKLKNAIMVDDISYVPVLYALSIDGYNVFRDGQKLNDGAVKSAAFTDTGIDDGRHGYQVSVVYNLGESNASATVYVSTATAIGDIPELKSDSYTVYTTDGRLIGKNLKKLPTLVDGVYIVNNKKVVIKR